MDDEELDRLSAQVEALSLAPDDALVLMCPHRLADGTADRLRDHLVRGFPGRKVVVLGDGMQLHPLGQQRQLDRIERSLGAVQAAVGAVLAALQEHQTEPEARTLDGDRYPSGERDQTTPL